MILTNTELFILLKNQYAVYSRWILKLSDINQKYSFFIYIKCLTIYKILWIRLVSSASCYCVKDINQFWSVSVKWRFLNLHCRLFLRQVF